MLGAQALRTKQKAEQKEKEKRQRERIRNLEIQRERIQKAAREDEAKFLQKMADLHLEDAQTLIEMAAESQKKQPTRHHSLHPAHVGNTSLTPNSARNRDSPEKLPQRSPSTDLGRSSVDSSGGSRFMKWLGLSSQGRDNKKPNRRASMFP